MKGKGLCCDHCGGELSAMDRAPWGHRCRYCLGCGCQFNEAGVLLCVHLMCTTA